jgi:autophagy-related protein 101
VKEAVRCIIHTILFNRALGAQAPTEPAAVHSEQANVSYMKLEDPGVELAVESKIKQFAEIFEKQMAPGAVLVLSFYTNKPKTNSIWNVLAGEDKIVFEQWRIPVHVDRTRVMGEQEDAHFVQTTKQIKRAISFALFKINQRMDHLPPAPPEVCYKFDLSFLSSQSTAGWPPSNFASLRHIPYLT